jgi:hypothetical protein
MSLEVQTKLIESGLRSSEAKVFLDSMPTAEQLMPALELREIEGRLPAACRRVEFLDDD